MLHMFKIDVPGDFSPALAGPDHKRMLLRARHRKTAAIFHPVFSLEPVCRGRIDQGEIDQVSMLPAELLE